MRDSSHPFRFQSLAGAAGACLLAAGTVTVLAADDPGWPRQFDFEKGVKLLVYQPQVEDWKDFGSLTARTAVTFEVPGFDEPILGALWMAMDTETDREARTVTLSNFQIAKVKFPTLDSEKSAKAEEALRRVFPTEPQVISLDRLLANVEREKVAVKDVPVSNKPPRVFTARQAATLVVIEGEPVMDDVPGTGLQAVLNTSELLLKDKNSGTFYLLYGAGWLKTSDLSGSWSAAGRLPAGFGKLPKTPEWASARAAVPGAPVKAEELPLVFVSQAPAELLVSYGEPQFEPIPGTNLLYVTNTEDDVFLSASDGRYYALFSGRWFRTRGKDQPLEFCSNDLPADFAKIPPDHTCGRVLASVPGTSQAQEAVIAAQIPQTATIDRKTASTQVTYEGEPKFEPVKGADVQYAVNTSQDVFLVNGKYYVCDQGVWFAGDSPNGPWVVCDSVPSAIYAIPPDHPAYNVTYVQVYSSTPETVVVGYRPGYLGAFVAGGLIVYGVGHAIWRHNHHYWRHCHRYRHYRRRTYGKHYHYNHWHGGYRPRPPHARPPHARPPRPTPYHGRPGARPRPYPGPKPGPRPGVKPGPRPGVKPGPRPGVKPGPRPGTGPKPGPGVGPKPTPRRPTGRPTPGRVRPGAPDLHVGRDGNIYRRQGNAWQRYDKGGQWRGAAPQRPTTARPPSPAVRPGARPSAARPKAPARKPSPSWNRTQRSLNRSSHSRTHGAKRHSQYQRYDRSYGKRTSASSRRSPSRHRAAPSRGGRPGGGRRR